MGLSRDVATFRRKIERASKAVGDSGDRKSMLPVARKVEGVLIASAASAGLHKGSRIAGRPWRGTYVRNQGTRDLAVGYAPPAHLVNNTMRSHVIGARKLGTRKRISRRAQGAGLLGAFGVAASTGLQVSSNRKGAAVLAWGGDHFARYVHHPGSKGKRFFERAKPTVRTEGADAMRDTVSRTLSRVFE